MKTRIVYRSISFTDLYEAGYKISVVWDDILETLRVADIFKDGKQLTKKDLSEALHYLGLKDNKHLTLKGRCQHVRLNGKKTMNYRFIGEERSDSKWIKSGFASEEANLNSSKMGGMLHDGMQMQRGGDRDHNRKKTT